MPLSKLQRQGELEAHAWDFTASGALEVGALMWEVGMVPEESSPPQ